MSLLMIETRCDKISLTGSTCRTVRNDKSKSGTCQMELKEKIKAIRKKVGSTQTDFAESLSIPLSTLKKYESGHSNIALPVITKITQHEVYKKFALWLLTDDVAPESGQFSPDDELLPMKNTGHINLPLFEISASAGTGLLVEVEKQVKSISFEPTWLRKEIGVNPNDVFLMFVDGDSMYPTLKNKSMIMVDRQLNGMSDGIYVLRHENSLLVKRLQMLPGGIIKVKSDNTMYEPWEINKKQLDGVDLELIGRVVWSGQRM